MAEKRVIEYEAASELANDDWLLIDGVTEGTRKARPSTVTAELGEQVTNIATTVGGLTAELVDIRVGADGTTYPSAGDAVRSQFDSKTNTYKNLYDAYAEDIRTGGFYLASNGTWQEDSSFLSTGYIKVSEGKKYRSSTWTTNYNSHITFWDSNKDFISGLTSLPNGYVTIPSGAVYIKIPLTNADRYNATFIEGTERPPYNMPYNKKTIIGDEALLEGVCIKDSVTENTAKVDNIIGHPNLFNPNDEDIVNNKFISGITDGLPIWTDFNGISESGFIAVKPNDKIVLYETNPNNLYDRSRIAYFDISKNIISTVGRATQDNYYNVPNDAAFVRVPFTTNRKDTLVVRTLADNETLPFDVTNEKSLPFGNWDIPTIVKKFDDYATEQEVDDIRQEIAGSVVLGAQWQGKTWYAYGTSITSVHQGTGKYPTYLAQMSGLNLVEKGIGGGGIGNLGAYSTGQVYAAICNITDGKLDADIITLETGANDVAADTPLGTIFDTGTSTLAGCLNDCIRYLQENTDAQIVVTPSPTAKNLGAAYENYETWAQMIEKICQLNRVHFIKPANNMGVAKLESSKGSLYVVDSIHQTDLGGYVMAQNIWYNLRNIPCFYTSIPT